MAKNLPNSYFLPIFVTKDQLKKLEANKSKFYFHNFLGNIRKDQLEPEGAYLIGKKVDEQTDRWTDGQLSIG